MNGLNPSRLGRNWVKRTTFGLVSLPAYAHRQYWEVTSVVVVDGEMKRPSRVG